jgi:tRNA-2-methylthio-N6-dimethylallyladenosine synthase
VEGTSKTDNRKLTGRTRQNHIVVFDFPENLHSVPPRANGRIGDPSLYIGKLVNVKIEDATDVTLYGSIESG